MDNYLTLEEVAKLLKVHIITIRRKIYSKELPCIKLSPKLIRIKESDLNNYLNTLS